MNLNIKDEFEALVISGPTGSGKNKLANILGNQFPIMVINADAIQVYKKWKILSGRPTDIEQKKVNHKLYGHYNGNYYNVGKWLKEVSYYVDKAKKNRLLPVIVGGTGLYINLLFQGISNIPNIPRKIRNKGKEILNSDPLFFYNFLKQKDPHILSIIDCNNSRRLQRAWEVMEATGVSLIEFQKDRETPILNFKKTKKIVLSVDKILLNKMIDLRFDKMIASGAIYECQRVLNEGIWDYTLPSSKIIGAHELVLYLQNLKSLEDAILESKIKTHQFAKRQRTWFRKNMKDWKTIEITNSTTFDNSMLNLI
jgi:tRNA dimethylallyltransferase